MPIFGLPAIFEKGFRDLHDEPQAVLGQCYMSNRDDLLLCYVRFAEDVDEGECLRSKLALYSKNNISPKTDGGTDFPAAGSTTIQEHDANYETALAGIPKDSPLRAFGKISIVGGAGAGQRGYITHYTNKVLNVRWYSPSTDSALAVALASNSDYVIWAPWYMEKAATNALAATSGIANAVAVTDAKKDKYGFVGVDGDLPVRIGSISVSPNSLLIPGTGSDRGRGVIADAADVPPAFAIANSSGPIDGLVDATVFCKRISAIEQLPEFAHRAFDRPEANSIYQ